MSLESWKQEFYQITAREAAKGDDFEATKHSIKKWEGALTENCKKHGVEYKYFTIIDKLNDDCMRFEDDNCALCEKYPKERHRVCVNDEGIRECPFFYITGSICPYDESENRPEIMVMALKKIINGLIDNGSTEAGSGSF